MKRKLLFFALLFIGSLQLKAQNTKDPYLPVLGENHIWYMASRLEFGGLHIYTLHSTDVVVYDGIEYIRIRKDDDEGPIEAKLREDIDERKVYRYNLPEDIVLYDFSLEVGDFFEYGSGGFYVDTIEYIDTEMGPRKAWFLSDNTSGNYAPVWIEGIGSIAGILTPNKQPNILWWDFPELLCYENDGNIEYKSDNGIAYGCQLESISTDELDNRLKVQIAPNPIIDNAIITFSNPFHNNVELLVFDAIGRLIRQLSTTTNNFSVNKTDYPAGMYFYRIQNNQHIYQSKFIVL